jgi:hypothetical protein
MVKKSLNLSHKVAKVKNKRNTRNRNTRNRTNMRVSGAKRLGGSYNVVWEYVPAPPAPHTIVKKTHAVIASASSPSSKNKTLNYASKSKFTTLYETRKFSHRPTHLASQDAYTSKSTV